MRRGWVVALTLACADVGALTVDTDVAGDSAETDGAPQDPLCLALGEWLAVAENREWIGTQAGDGRAARFEAYECRDPLSADGAGTVNFLVTAELLEDGTFEPTGSYNEAMFRCSAREYDQGWQIENCTRRADLDPPEE